MSNRYKLVVLQGGGYYGLINTTFLTYLGKDYQLPKKVNSISGCSIGGIETCILMAGVNACNLQKMFIDKGAQIFKRRNHNILDIPWYSDEGLKNALTELIKDNTLKDTKNLYPDTTMFVPAFNLTKNKLKVYDNIDEADSNMKLVDIALNTAAAMFYFPIRKNENNDAIVDGGVRQVCPVLIHATGVKSKLNIDYKDMDVFVIGAGTVINNQAGNYDEVNSWGAIDWLTKFIIPDITASNENTSKFFGEHIGFNSFEWFNPVQVYGSMDDVSQTDYMLNECSMYKELFLDKWNEFINK